MQSGNIFVRIFVLCMAVFMLQACREELNSGSSGTGKAVVKMRVSSFASNDTAQEDARPLTETCAYLFEEGVLKTVYRNLSSVDGGFELRLDRLSGELYVIAGEAGFAMEVDGKSPEEGQTTEEM